jgi:hypothetical protein
MDLKSVAKKPQLQCIKLDSDQILNTYGEPLEFYMWDRFSMTDYMKISSIDQKDTSGMLAVVYDLVCDAEGNTMLDEDDQLPPAVMVDMINAVVDHLGNLAGQTSTKPGTA